MNSFIMRRGKIFVYKLRYVLKEKRFVTVCPYIRLSVDNHKLKLVAVNRSSRNCVEKYGLVYGFYRYDLYLLLHYETLIFETIFIKFSIQKMVEHTLPPSCGQNFYLLSFGKYAKYITFVNAYNFNQRTHQHHTSSIIC